MAAATHIAAAIAAAAIKVRDAATTAAALEEEALNIGDAACTALVAQDLPVLAASNAAQSEAVTSTGISPAQTLRKY